MTEWYVYLEHGVPKEVILGRRAAFTKLGVNERVFRGYILGRIISLGEPVTMGFKSLYRTIGPGTEV